MPYFPRKTQKISDFYKIPYKELLYSLYIVEELSPIEIAEKFIKETGVYITMRPIQTDVKRFGFGRTKSASISLAIKNGRKSYAHLRKPIKANENRKGISLKVRYQIFERDNFRCVICGVSTKDGKEIRLVIDHIVPVVSGGLNEFNNLRTLCTACNHGKMIFKNEK